MHAKYTISHKNLQGTYGLMIRWHTGVLVSARRLVGEVARESIAA